MYHHIGGRTKAVPPIPVEVVVTAVVTVAVEVVDVGINHRVEVVIVVPDVARASLLTYLSCLMRNKRPVPVILP